MKFTTSAALLLASVAAAAPAPRAAAGDLGTAIADTALAGVFNPAGLSKPIGDIVSAATGGAAGAAKAGNKPKA